MQLPSDRQKLLKQATTVVMGMEDRSLEAICTLEILYGTLHNFSWKEGVNIHNLNDKSYDIDAAAHKCDKYTKTALKGFLCGDVQLYQSPKTCPSSSSTQEWRCCVNLLVKTANKLKVRSTLCYFHLK